MQLSESKSRSYDLWGAIASDKKFGKANCLLQQIERQDTAKLKSTTICILLKNEPINVSALDK